MATWTELSADDVYDAMPADMVTMYDAWIVANPEKATRLAELTAEMVEACRAAVEAGSPWALEGAGAGTVPTTGRRHLITLVHFSIGLEMGYAFAEGFYSLVTRADIWLRGVQAGTVAIASASGSLPSPSYEPPEPAGRVLDG